MRGITSSTLQGNVSHGKEDIDKPNTSESTSPSPSINFLREGDDDGEVGVTNEGSNDPGCCITDTADPAPFASHDTTGNLTLLTTLLIKLSDLRCGTVIIVFLSA